MPPASPYNTRLLLIGGVGARPQKIELRPLAGRPDGLRRSRTRESSKVECLVVSVGVMVLGSKWKFRSETGPRVVTLLEAMILLRVMKVLMRIINMLFGNTVMTTMS